MNRSVSLLEGRGSHHCRRACGSEGKGGWGRIWERERSNWPVPRGPSGDNPLRGSTGHSPRIPTSRGSKTEAGCNKAESPLCPQENQESAPYQGTSIKQ